MREELLASENIGGFTPFQIVEPARPLCIGFLPLNDCAPLIMARELGLFTKYGLDVQLKREASWSIIQDKIVYGALDAAHAPAAMPFAVNLCTQTPRVTCVTGLILNLQNAAIAVSQDLWKRVGKDPAGLRDEILRLRGKKTFTFASVFQYSSQHFLLRQWLRSVGVNPDRDVRIVMVPPTQMFPNLKLGYLDGFCAGEPWTSVAVEAGAAWCVATSAELAPLHPDKALVVRRAFAEQRANEHIRLLAALIEACAFCDRQENREHVCKTIAHPSYVNAPPSCLRPSLSGRAEFGEARTEPLRDLLIFARYRANEPAADRANWIVHKLVEMRAVKESMLQSAVIHEVFRPDIFYEARQLVREQAKLIDPSFGIIPREGI
jgi:two-component system, oxyanion-binding sensor